MKHFKHVPTFCIDGLSLIFEVFVPEGAHPSYFVRTRSGEVREAKSALQKKLKASLGTPDEWRAPSPKLSTGLRDAMRVEDAGQRRRPAGRGLL